VNKVAFGKTFIEWSSTSNNGPIASLNLEIEKPCFESHSFQSGLANNDNSIYQFTDFNFFVPEE
jgi:hypothetical protein